MIRQILSEGIDFSPFGYIDSIFVLKRKTGKIDEYALKFWDCFVDERSGAYAEWINKNRIEKEQQIMKIFLKMEEK